jgi:Right handed beta helix region
MPTTLPNVALDAREIYHADGTKADIIAQGEAEFDFRAFLDGAPSVAAAFEAAMVEAETRGGMLLRVPEGTYDLAGRVLIPSNTTIDFHPGALVRYTGTADIGEVTGVFENRSLGASRITIVGLRYDDLSPDSAGAHCAISMSGASGVLIRDCYFRQTGLNTRVRCVFAEATSFIWVERCDCWTSGWGARADACEYGFVTENTIETRRDLNLIPNGIALYEGCRGFTIYGNNVRGTGDEGISTQGCFDVTVDGNTIYNCHTQGVDIRGGSMRVAVTNNNVWDCGIGAADITASIRVSAKLGGPCIGVVVDGNTILSAQGTAIKEEKDGPNQNLGTVISANIVYDTTGGAGIVAQGIGTTLADNEILFVGGNGIEVNQGAAMVSAVNNFVWQAGRNGISAGLSGCTDLTLTGNRIYNCGQEAAGTYYGIELLTVTDATISLNKIRDVGTPKNHKRQIYLKAVTNSLVESNTMNAGANLPNILRDGTTPASTLVRNNIGFLTRNRGTALIGAASTSIVVAHGLDATPNEFSITCMSSIGAATKPPYVSGVTATQFTLNLDAPPGGAGASFQWTAQAT